MRDRSSALLAAYVDGVSELTADERRALEERLAGEPALRADAEQTRALLGQLRDLPPERTAEPDWAALERSILGAVGPGVPRPWWRRLGWRWAVPAAALAVGAAILALVLRTPERASEPALARPAPAPRVEPTPTPKPGDTMALWLDGEDIEIDLAAEELPAVPWESDDRGADDRDETALLPADDLAWVDDLVDEELERAEMLLQDPELGRAIQQGGKADGVRDPRSPDERGQRPARRKRS